MADAAIADAWDEIQPFVEMVDAELSASGEAALTFFELLTVLAFVVAADAPIDVLVLEVGMGGEWDSTNTADGDVAVFAPIDIDHADRLGSTIAEIATVKAGIIKPGAAVVSAAQPAEALRAIRARAEKEGATVAVAGDGFTLESQTLAVGGQQLDIRGVAGTYREVYLPLYGAHQERTRPSLWPLSNRWSAGHAAARRRRGGRRPGQRHVSGPPATHRHGTDGARRRRA